MQGPHYSSPSYPPRFLRRNHIEDNAEDDGILRRCWDTYAMINALVRNYSYSQEIKMSQSFKDLIIMARLILNFFLQGFWFHVHYAQQTQYLIHFAKFSVGRTRRYRMRNGYNFSRATSDCSTEKSRTKDELEKMMKVEAITVCISDFSSSW